MRTNSRRRKILPTTISEAEMAQSDVRSIALTGLSIVLVLGAIYLVDPTFFGFLRLNEGFEGAVAGGTLSTASNGSQPADLAQMPGAAQAAAVDGNPNSVGGDPSAALTAALTAAMPAMKKAAKGATDVSGEGFADLEEITGPAAFESAQGPAGCYPRDQLTPSELLPKDASSVWAQQNPMGTGSLKGKNFLSAGALVGVNTVGQSLRNANWQLRSEPPNPQVPVSVFYNSTIEPDTNRRDLEIN